MSAEKALPPLLTQYLRLPPEVSLSLVTSVLGASANWVLERYLIAALAGPSRHGEETEAGAGEDTRVVLVSWMSNWDSWRTEIRRTSGLDIAKLAQQHRFAFVDGLTGLLDSSNHRVPTKEEYSSGEIPIKQSPQSIRSPGTTPTVLNMSPIDPAPRKQGNLSPGPPELKQDSRSASIRRPVKLPAENGRYVLSSDSLISLENTTLRAKEFVTATQASSEDSKEPRVLLILDQPDLLLSTTQDPSKCFPALLSTITALSQLQYVQATVVGVGADPHLTAAATAELDREEAAIRAFSPLESHHSAFLMSLAHRARVVFQLRRLESGWASDVSGVLRVSPGGAWDSGDEEVASNEGVEGQEKEMLYCVKADGSVKVFERGAGGVG
ncbi:hypothetical protein NA57DRAFT_51795 [Rhizodiscina lignyota]|uniref:Elongator complex protein 6 n=1 Tax=Rhizodiscina lignyota TaxID=1504668 RepID=A0A9P4MBU7_9PEZI|nr:hypothetical protein NA57DRAFT_51795 [Rhizodiscina lignyota]